MFGTLTASEQLAISTVRLEVLLSTGGASIGTGFFYNFCLDIGGRPGIVTNKHVVKDGIRARLWMSTANSKGEWLQGQHKGFQLEDLQASLIHHPDPDVDLCVIPLRLILNDIIAKGLRPFYRTLDYSLIMTEDESSDLAALEEIVMIGYPVGLWDSANNMPLFRRGITATHPHLNYADKPDFMIDAACYPGSSGSPVFLFNQGNYTTRNTTYIGSQRLKLLGVLYAGPTYTASGELVISTVPTNISPAFRTSIPMNLGIAVKANQLQGLEEVIRAM